MIQISNELKNKLNTSTSIKVKNKIVVGTTEYDSSIIKTYPKISHKNSSVFGGFPSKTCSFEIYNHNSNIDFENKEIKLYKGIEVSGSIEWILQGIFIPRAKDIETNITSKTISFNKVQDKTQLFDVPYKSDLSWDNNVTHTGLEIIQEICTKLSIDLSSNTFNLSSYSFKQPNFAENITCREIISRFAEIAGSIAFINREGKLEIKAPTNTSSTIERSRYIKLTKENEIYFNTLVLGKDGINDDIVYPETIATDRVEYKILDNPFVDLYREDMIEDISANIIGKSYVPFTLNNFVDGFCFDLNDVISVKDRNGNTLDLTIFNYETANRISTNVSAETMGTMTTNYNLAGSSKNELKEVKLNVDHNNKSIIALSKRTTDNETSISQLEITTEEISSTVSETTKEQNEKISKITQTTNEINSKISDIADITTSGESQQASVNLVKVNESEPIAIKIHPTTEDISYLYPSDYLYPADDLYLNNRIIRFTNTDTNEVFDYELPDDLLYYDANNYDEFILNYDSQTCSIIKRIEYIKETNKNAIKTIEETINYGFPTIALSAGNYTVSLPGYSNAYIYVQLMASNIYTTQFATKVEMNSEISQTKSDINLKVNELTQKDNELKSEIDLTKNDINLKVSQLSGKDTQLQSEIDVQAKQIVLKVDSNGKIVKATLTTDPTDGTAFTIDADNINLTATDIINLLANNTINLTSKNIVIDSTNFKVDKGGNTTMGNANITGGNILLDAPSEDYAKIQIGKENNYSKFAPIYYNIYKNNKLRTQFAWNLLKFYTSSSSDEEYSQMSAFGINFASGGTNVAYMNSDGIVGAYTYNNLSLASRKKNFEKFKNALAVINDIDIYKFNYKKEQNGTKKHLGFVIGEKFRYSKTITNNNNDAADLYSMASLCLQAIKEQQEIINELKEEIEKLKERNDENGKN